MKRLLLAGALSVSLSFLCDGRELRAQDITPLLPPPVETMPSPAAPLSPPPVTDEETPVHVNPDEVLVDRLDAIWFEFAPDVPAPETVRRRSGSTAGLLPVAAAVPAGVDNKVPALTAALADANSPLSKATTDALSNPLTWRRLDTLLAATTQAARDAGWSLARTYVPEQEVGSGVLRVAVVPVVLEGVDVDDTRWTRPANLQRQFAKHTGEIVGLRDYGAPLVFLNQHPFRRVTPLLAPGETLGATRLKLAVTEEKPWRFFSGFETTHSRHSGVGRITGGFMVAAPWRTEDILTAQYSTDNDFEHLKSASVSYRAALPWGHFLTATGLWAKSDSSPARYLDYHTKDWMTGLDYTVPLPAFAGVTHEVSLGWEWRRFEGQYYIMGEPFDDGSKADMAPFSLGWRGWRVDRAGTTSLSMKVLWNPGAYLGGHMSRADYESHRFGTSPSFATLAWEVRRDWRLPADFGLLNRAWGQFADRRLVDPARFFLGGNRSVRGYRESELGGDGGWGATMELTSPAWRSARGGGEPSTAGACMEVRLAGFWDWGQVYRKGPRETWENQRLTGSGAGLGVRAMMGKWGSVRVDRAWRLRDTNVPEDNVRGYWHIGANLYF